MKPYGPFRFLAYPRCHIVQMIPAWFISMHFSLAIANNHLLTAFLAEQLSLQMEHIVKAPKVGEILGRCVYITLVDTGGSC
jgi:hypothetical protein